jgi:Holliday junction resolvase-like predicted endonuclease
MRKITTIKKPKILKKISYFMGIVSEIYVIIYLILIGHKIIKWRYQNIFGEIDIITKKNNKIIAIEVKYRNKISLNYETIISFYKSQKIAKALEVFIEKNNQLKNYGQAIDFIAINKFFKINHIKNFS